MDKRDFGIALSGGGHRASLFAMGTLLYLVDSRTNERVATISSVSGGSIASGFVAQRCDFGTVTDVEFDDIAAQFVSTIAGGGVLSVMSWILWLYVAILATTGAAIAAVLFASWPIELPGWICALLILAWGGLLLLRGVPVAWLMGKTFFRDEHGKPVRLGQLRNLTVDHVLCATDLTTAAPFYFYCGKHWAAYSPIYNRACAGNVTLQSAVRASAAFPGAIPPKLVRTRALEWAAVFNDSKFPVPRPPRYLFLADGGVWNNLGTQFFERDQEVDRAMILLRVTADEEIPNNDPGKLLIVDGSGPIEPVSSWELLVPFWAEARGLARVMSLLYANTVRPRMRQIGESKRAFWRWGDQYDRDWDIPKAGVSIAFEDNPQAGRIYTGLGFPESDHAQSFLAREEIWNQYVESEMPDEFWLGGEPLRYEDLISLCASEPTHLSAVAAEKALALLFYGYISTMQVMYLTYETPLIRPFPSVERFKQFLSPPA